MVHQTFVIDEIVGESCPFDDDFIKQNNVEYSNNEDIEKNSSPNHLNRIQRATVQERGKIIDIQSMQMEKTVANEEKCMDINEIQDNNEEQSQEEIIKFESYHLEDLESSEFIQSQDFSASPRNVNTDSYEETQENHPELQPLITYSSKDFQGTFDTEEQSEIFDAAQTPVFNQLPTQNSTSYLKRIPLINKPPSKSSIEVKEVNYNPTKKPMDEIDILPVQVQNHNVENLLARNDGNRWSNNKLSTTITSEPSRQWKQRRKRKLYEFDSTDKENFRSTQLQQQKDSIDTSPDVKEGYKKSKFAVKQKNPVLEVCNSPTLKKKRLPLTQRLYHPLHLQKKSRGSKQLRLEDCFIGNKKL